MPPLSCRISHRYSNGSTTLPVASHTDTPMGPPHFLSHLTQILQWVHHTSCRISHRYSNGSTTLASWYCMRQVAEQKLCMGEQLWTARCSAGKVLDFIQIAWIFYPHDLDLDFIHQSLDFSCARIYCNRTSWIFWQH